MKGRIVRVLFKDVYPVYLNGIAIGGWFAAAMYGFASMIKVLLFKFQ